jgi:hypothetical protein
MTTMYTRIPSDHHTPLRALGLDFASPRDPMDFIDLMVEVRTVLSRGQGLAAVCHSAIPGDNMEVAELRHALELLHAYLEAAGLALSAWREDTLANLQAQEEDPDA